jgi:hypothetical protein
MKKPGKARLLMRLRQLTVVSCIPKVARGGSSNQPATITIWNPNFRKKQEFDVLRDLNTKLVTPIARSNRFKHLIMTYKYYMPNLSKTAQFRVVMGEMVWPLIGGTGGVRWFADEWTATSGDRVDGPSTDQRPPA